MGFLNLETFDQPMKTISVAPPFGKRIKKVPIGADPVGTKGTLTLYVLEDMGIIVDSATKKVSLLPYDQALAAGPWEPMTEGFSSSPSADAPQPEGTSGSSPEATSFPAPESRPRPR